MKVMCIINEPWVVGVGPSFGEEVTAYQCPVHARCYKLIEYPRDCSYVKKHFVPISDIDETETEVYKNLQTQTV